MRERTHFPVRHDGVEHGARMALSWRAVRDSLRLLRAAPAGLEGQIPPERRTQLRDDRFLTVDDRHVTPTLGFALGVTDDEAREQALGLLREDRHHLAVEAWADDELQFVVTVDGREAPRTVDGSGRGKWRAGPDDGERRYA